MRLKKPENQLLRDQKSGQACALSSGRVRIEISKPNQRNSLIFNAWKSQSAQNHFDSKRWGQEPFGNANGSRQRPARHTKSRNDLHGGNHYKRCLQGPRRWPAARSCGWSAEALHSACKRAARRSIRARQPIKAANFWRARRGCERSVRHGRANPRRTVARRQ